MILILINSIKMFDVIKTWRFFSFLFNFVSVKQQQAVSLFWRIDHNPEPKLIGPSSKLE